MVIEYINLQLILLLAVGFSCAAFFGYIAMRLNMSPILGYLIAGFIIGPYSPGFVGDLALARQLAEVGVLLMMFSVGMHFTFNDLLKVRKVAIPGALLQTLTATILGMLLFMSLGQSPQAGIIFGLSIAVASTVVLVRGLKEHNLFKTFSGQVAVGWLILEDKITVAALLLLPTLALVPLNDASLLPNLLEVCVLLVVKFILFAILLFTLGRVIAKYILEKVETTGSHELYTITVLALAFAFAELANIVFGLSIVIGAFLAGIVIARTDSQNKVASHTKSLEEAFVVIFFLSMGMLFNVQAVYEHFALFVGTLAIILLAKPLTAYLLARGFSLTKKDSLVIAVALAQIGEFTFILAEEAYRFDILPALGYDVLVACALVSISINPFLFKWVSSQPEEA